MWELRDVAPAMNEDLEGDKLPEQIPLAYIYPPWPWYLIQFLIYFIPFQDVCVWH